MNVFYEESGSFKVGTVVSKTDTSYQVDTQHGKRAKLKAASVYLEFATPLDAFLREVEAQAAEIDLDFLWEVCGGEEFTFQNIAAEYFGASPSVAQQGAILMRIFGAPMYFYKKAKGHFKPAPEDALKAALAGIEKKKREQEQIDAWVAELSAGTLPEAIRSQLMEILHRPNKQSLEFKAFDAACQAAQQAPLKFAAKLGGVPSVTDYLLAGFLMEHFPKGRGFPALEIPTLPTDLPVAGVAAFSIDDAATTEIDDALSVVFNADGSTTVGIHIAAPTLGVAVGSDIEKLVYNRLSTVYFPGDKITMLPDEVVEAFTLQEGRNCPAFSLYVTVDAELNPVAFENRIEAVPIAANLRHDALETVFNEAALADPSSVPDYPFKRELTWLHGFAEALEKRRGKYDPTRPVQHDYGFVIEDGKVRITTRRRGAPMDKLVAELMILANSEWGRMLAEANIPALYRAQSMGKVRMTTKPEPHVGLGVAQYAWSTSPLRRASDFVNQRQLAALISGDKPQFEQGDAMLFALLRDFDTAYSAYLGFQDRMEYFWCLRWFSQEGVNEIEATYIKDDLVRLIGLPLRTRVTGLPPLASGDTIRLAVARIDELELALELRYVGKVGHDDAALAEEVEDPAAAEASEAEQG